MCVMVGAFKIRGVPCTAQHARWQRWLEAAGCYASTSVGARHVSRHGKGLTKAHRNPILPVGPVVLAQCIALLALPLAAQELLEGRQAGP
jgi:hypothetical protein